MKLKYAVVYERTPNNYGAYAPELPGCIATAKSLEEIRAMIREAITFHIEGLTEHGDPVPEPRMSVSEARAYHLASLADAGEPDPKAEAMYGMAEVEIMPSRTATAR